MIAGKISYLQYKLGFKMARSVVMNSGALRTFSTATKPRFTIETDELDELLHTSPKTLSIVCCTLYGK